MIFYFYRSVYDQVGHNPLYFDINDLDDLENQNHFDLPNADSDFPLTTEWQNQRGAKIRDLKANFEGNEKDVDGPDFSDAESTGSNDYVITQERGTQEIESYHSSMDEGSLDGSAPSYESITKVDIGATHF